MTIRNICDYTQNRAFRRLTTPTITEVLKCQQVDVCRQKISYTKHSGPTVRWRTTGTLYVDTETINIT